jgi:hypothetical protein
MTKRKKKPIKQKPNVIEWMKLSQSLKDTDEITGRTVDVMHSKHLGKTWIKVRIHASGILGEETKELLMREDTAHVVAAALMRMIGDGIINDLPQRDGTKL